MPRNTEEAELEKFKLIREEMQFEHGQIAKRMN